MSTRARAAASFGAGRDAPWLAALFIGSLGLGAVRLRSNLGLFRDEAATAMVVDRSFSDMLEVILEREPGMGPYYVSLWLWSRLSTSDLWIRAFSVFGGALAVSLAFLLCRRWASRPVAVAASLLLATSWFLHQYMTMARSYTWLLVAFLGFGLMIERYRDRRTTAAATLVGLLAGLCLALTPYAAFWLITLVIAYLIVGWIPAPSLRNVVVACTAALLVVLPFVPALVRQRQLVDWIDDVSMRDARIIVQNLFGGTRLLVVFLLGAVCAAVAAIRNRSLSDPLKGAVVCAITSALPVGLMLIFSEIVRPSFVGRYLACSVPMACIAAAIGTAEVSGRRSVVGLVVLLLLPLTLFVQRSPLADSPRGDDMRAASEFLEQAVEPGDSVLFRPSWARTMLARYWGWHPESDPTVVATANMYYPQESVDSTAIARLEASDRIWVVGYELPALRGDAVLVVDLSRRRLVSETVVGGVTFLLFE